MAKYVLELEVDSKGAVTGIKQVEKEVDKLNKKTEEAAKNSPLSGLEKVSPKAAAAVKMVTGNITQLAGGFKTLKMAIISTGIGALVIAVTSLVVFFTKSQKGADMLSRATAGLGAAMSIVTDTLAKLGEFLVSAFEDPQQSIKDLWEAIKKNLVNRLTGLRDQFVSIGKIAQAAFTLDWEGLKQGAEDFARALIQVNTGLDKEQQDAFAKSIAGVASEMNEAAKAAIKLKQAEQDLRDVTRELNVDQAESRARIKGLNKDAEDTTKSYKEREDAARKAGEMEEALVKRRVAAAKENLRIIQESNKLSASMDDDLDAEAEAKIALFQIEEESLELQTTLQNKFNTLKQQRESEYTNHLKAEIEERNKASAAFDALELERAKALAETQKEILNDIATVRDFLADKLIHTEAERIESKYEVLREQAGTELELLKELEIQKGAELGAVKLEQLLKDSEAAKKVKDDELKDAEAVDNSKKEFAKSTSAALMDIGNLLVGNSEKNAKKMFAVNKALSIAEAIQSTWAGANTVWKDPTLPFAAKPFAIGAVVASGLANVAKIAATKFGGAASGGGGGSSSLGAPNVTGGAAAPTAAIDFSALGGNQQEPIRSYVLDSDVQSAQEANTRVKDLTTL